MHTLQPVYFVPQAMVIMDLMKEIRDSTDASPPETSSQSKTSRRATLELNQANKAKMGERCHCTAIEITVINGLLFTC